jgi:hypothetical protein
MYRIYFHFLCSAQAVANRMNADDEARMGPTFWEDINDGLGFAYNLPSIEPTTIDYGDTLVLEIIFLKLQTQFLILNLLWHTIFSNHYSTE